MRGAIKEDNTTPCDKLYDSTCSITPYCTNHAHVVPPLSIQVRAWCHVSTGLSLVLHGVSALVWISCTSYKSKSLV